MQEKIPKIDKTVLVTDDPLIAAELSSIKNKSGYYFPVLESPRMERPDAHNEIIRTGNSLARVQPSRVILGNLNLEATQSFKQRIPKDLLLELQNKEEIDTHIKTSRKEITWGKSNLAIGLLKAKYKKSRLRITDNASPQETFVKGNGVHLVILEERNDISSVIAANYCFSINADLLVVSAANEKDADNIIELFYTLYSEEGHISIDEKIRSLRSKIRSMLPPIDFKGIKCITFITNGLPWGMGFPEIPTTHIPCYPHMGNYLVTALVAEQPVSPGIRVALMVDPGNQEESELTTLAEYFSKRGTYVRGLFSKKARVRYVSDHIATFPYDFLAFSTHAGEIAGRRIKYQFLDSESINRELVIDLAAGFGVKPGEELIEVIEYTRFISLDGIPWDNEEKKKEHYIGKAITDFFEYQKSKSDRLKIIETTPAPRVLGAMALKMHDHYLIPLFHSIADDCNPIVLNNACSSWKEMSGHFIFTGARIYIGTMFEVTNIEAKELATQLITKHGNRPLVFGLWKTQNDIYDSQRNPYVITGVHFARLRPNKINSINYLIFKMKRAIRNWTKLSEESGEEDIKKNSKKNADFLTEQLNALTKKWK